jgi:hypothetical protein
VGLAAFDAMQHCPYESRPTFPARHPRPILPRRIVTHVLGVSTFEIRYPVAVIVEMKPDDLSRARRPVGELRARSQRVTRMSDRSGSISATSAPLTGIPGADSSRTRMLDAL